MATRILQRQFGGPDCLTVEEFTPPSAAQLAPGEVLVKVAAAGVNPADVITRTGGGMAASGLIQLPFTPGWDLAGTIQAVGPEVTDLVAGDRVLGLVRFPGMGGAYAQAAVAPASDLVRAPENLSDAQAGALPMAAMTAWQAFTETTAVQLGDRVLITGAGGGVGHLAVQLAHRLGATVIAVASASKHQWLRELGADETIDYHSEEQLSELEKHPVDVALSLAEGSRQLAVHTVRAGGVLIGLGVGADSVAEAAERAGVRLAITHVHGERSWLEEVTNLAARGVLTPTVTQIFDLPDAADAHRALEAGHSTGKIVLRMSAPKETE